MNIINHKTKETCELKFHNQSYFAKEITNKVTGLVKDSNNLARYLMDGTCTEKFDCTPILKPTQLNSAEDLKHVKLGPSKTLWIRSINE